MDFDGLVDRYEKPIYNLVFRLVGDPEEAADLTQETFLAAYRSASDFRGDAAVFTWLYRIAVNRCKNSFKRRDRRREFEELSLDQPGVELEQERMADGAAHYEAPDLALQRKELRQRIEQAITQLPPDYRIVAVLRDLNGLSYQEIAEIADLSVDVVRTRLARARGMLRQKLQAYLES